MADDLAQLQERIDFARSEIALLEVEIASYFEASLKIDISDSLVPDTVDLHTTLSKAVPTRIPARAGTIANELRAVLDGLACQLAVRNGQTSAGVYFPISKTKAVFADDGMRKIRKLSLADQAVIVGLKPNGEDNRVLFGLHEADRTRKHQRLAACGCHNVGVVLGPIRVNGNTERLVFLRCGFNDHYSERMEIHSTRLGELGIRTLMISGIPKGLPIEDLTFSVAYTEPVELDGEFVPDTLVRFADEASKIVDMFR